MNQLLEVYLHSVGETYFFQLCNPERAFNYCKNISCLNPGYSRSLIFSATKSAQLGEPPRLGSTLHCWEAGALAAPCQCASLCPNLTKQDHSLPCMLRSTASLQTHTAEEGRLVDWKGHQNHHLLMIQCK